MSQFWLDKHMQALQPFSFIFSLLHINTKVIFLAGLSSRPLVNFPDTINLKETIVKVPCNKTFYIKNIGQIPAVFNMVCEK